MILKIKPKKITWSRGYEAHVVCAGKVEGIFPAIEFEIIKSKDKRGKKEFLVKSDIKDFPKITGDNAGNLKGIVQQLFEGYALSFFEAD